jgi:outer membrane murein-binding lipoprotein Lpp
MNIEYRSSNFVSRRFTFAAVLLCSLMPAAFITGCESSGSPENPLAGKVDKLTDDNRDLTRQNKLLESKNKELQKQMNTLHNLPDDIKLKDFYDVTSIRITKHTNLVDKDKDGKKETLVVYIKPFDVDGDIIKVAGSVDVQLLDLDKDKEPVVLGKWHVTPDRLKKLWFNALLKTNYRLTFDVSDKVESYEEPLTVTVTFTDYLTGKVFEEQKLIKPL